MEAQDLTAELVAVEDEGAPDAQPNCSSDESLLASMKHTDGPKIPKCKYNRLSTHGPQSVIFPFHHVMLAGFLGAKGV